MATQDDNLVFPEETFRIRGAIYEVARAMGPGFLEAVYQECLAREFVLRGIPFSAQLSLPLTYKGQPLRQRYTADFVCFGSILLELKAVRAFAPEHRMQLLNYMKASGLSVGLLVNFGGPKAQVERLVS